MQMGKQGPDDALTLRELESARSGLRIQMLEAWMRATESYEKGEYRACIADCSEAAYCCWLACDVCVHPAFFIYLLFFPTFALTSPFLRGARPCSNAAASGVDTLQSTAQGTCRPTINRRQMISTAFRISLSLVAFCAIHS